MTASLKVLAPGIHTTVQDPGRIGHMDAGVPISGPLDRVGLRLANALVGNGPEVPALEMLLQGATFEVAAEAVRVALAGCHGTIVVEGTNARRIAAGRSVRLVRGDTFNVSQLGDSACGYLAVEGGIAVEPSLGSASTYTRGRMGGLAGSALKRGDAVPLRLDVAPQRAEKALARPFDLELGRPVRVVLGPQDDYFTEAAIETLLASEYVVSAQSDRMGFRLEGAPLTHAKGYNIVSDGIVPGSIQVPGSGLPIILLADAQTTGGYPKIATVVSADIPALGRRRPGRALRFEAVDVAQAEALRRAQEDAVRQMIDTLQQARPVAAIDVTALYRENLVSGVASAP